MRVLGALYGVTLVVSNGDQSPGRSAKQQKAGRNGRVPARSARAGEAAIGAVTSARKRTDSRRASGSPTNSEIRSWARESGLAVSDRGRVPASVISAYREANAR
jgi:hypothetical protein